MVVCYKAYPVLGGVQHPIGAKYVEIGWCIDKDGWIQILKNYGKIILKIVNNNFSVQISSAHT